MPITQNTAYVLDYTSQNNVYNSLYTYFYAALYEREFFIIGNHYAAVVIVKGEKLWTIFYPS